MTLFPYHNPFLLELGAGPQAGTCRSELKQRPRRNAADCLALRGLLSLLSHITQDYQPNVAPLTTGQALPHPNINQGNTQTCPQNNLIETIAQLRFSLPKYVKVCVNLQANQRRPPPHSLNVNSPWAVHTKHIETLTQYQPGPPPPPLHATCARRTWNHSKFDLNQMKIV